MRTGRWLLQVMMFLAFDACVSGYLDVCACVCTHMLVHTDIKRMYACINAYMYQCMHVPCESVCIRNPHARACHALCRGISMCACVCALVCMCVALFFLKFFVFLCIGTTFVSGCMSVRMCMHAWDACLLGCACMLAGMKMCVCVCVHVYIHVCVCTYMGMNTYV